MVFFFTLHWVTLSVLRYVTLRCSVTQCICYVMFECLLSGLFFSLFTLGTLTFIMLFYATLRCIIYVMLGYLTSGYVLFRCFTLGYFTLHYVTLCYIKVTRLPNVNFSDQTWFSCIPACKPIETFHFRPPS